MLKSSRWKNNEGEKMPSIFYDVNHRNKWLPAIELCNKVKPVYDNEENKILGLQ